MPEPLGTAVKDQPAAPSGTSPAERTEREFGVKERSQWQMAYLGRRLSWPPEQDKDYVMALEKLDMQTRVPMLGLPWVTWIRFALWLLLGMAIYLSYGFKRSGLVKA